MDAIPIVKRPFIMRVLNSQGNYDVTIRGRHVRLYRSQKTGSVCYRVGNGPRNIGGDAPSAGQAIEEVNRILQGNHQPRPYQLPYKDDSDE